MTYTLVDLCRTQPSYRLATEHHTFAVLLFIRSLGSIHGSSLCPVRHGQTPDTLGPPRKSAYPCFPLHVKLVSRTGPATDVGEVRNEHYSVACSEFISAAGAFRWCDSRIGNVFLAITLAVCPDVCELNPLRVFIEKAGLSVPMTVHWLLLWSFPQSRQRQS